MFALARVVGEKRELDGLDVLLTTTYNANGA